MDETLFARRCRLYFDLQSCEDKIHSGVLCALGIDPGSDQDWPYDDYGFDWYDSSMELHNVFPGFRITMEQVETILAMGLQRIFVNYSDGTTRVYRAGFESEVFPANTPVAPYATAM